MAKKKAATREGRFAISGQLRDVIESRGLTAYALGKGAGVDATVIMRFLSGERDLRLATVDKLAAALAIRLVEVGRTRKAARRG